ncbi:MAG TPA: hypothetical protein VF377_06875 [Acidimicrobiia bacterium]
MWSIREWSSGIGFDVWRPNQGGYRAGAAMLTEFEEGFTLPRLAETTELSAAALTDGGVLGLAQGVLWTVDDAAGYAWDSANGDWDTGVATGGTTNQATSIADGHDTWVYTGHSNGVIRRWKSGSNEAHYSTFGEDPVLVDFGGILFALDSDDLYEIDKTTADTRTQRADLTGSSSLYLAATPWCYNRLTVSDVGPVWLQRLNSGETHIWEYNVAEDVQARIGKLPATPSFPYSIFWANGFVFVGFRYAPSHSAPGLGYLYYQRGSQRGVAGPFSRDVSSSASAPVLIAGMVGDDVIVIYDGTAFAYNLTAGGISEVGTVDDSRWSARVFGRDIFAGGGDNKHVQRLVDGKYAASAVLLTGRHDMEYPGLRKRLLDVTVVTDPLPSGTSVGMTVIVDGGDPITLTGSHDTDDAQRFTWSAASTSADIVGYQFELRPTLASTDENAAPVVRELIATAAAAAHRIEWVLSIDCSDMSWQEIDNLNAMAGDIVTFTDDFQNRDSDDPDSFVVQVAELLTPRMFDPEGEEHVVGRIRLLSRDLLVTGSS